MKLQIADCRVQIEWPIVCRIAAVSIAAAFGLALHAQSPEIDAHVAAAKAAVGRDHQVLFTSLCSAEPTGPGTRRGGAAPTPGAAPAPPPGPPAKDTWHAEPVQVFDNLYFL